MQTASDSDNVIAEIGDIPLLVIAAVAFILDNVGTIGIFFARYIEVFLAVDIFDIIPAVRDVIGRCERIERYSGGQCGYSYTNSRSRRS